MAERDGGDRDKSSKMCEKISFDMETNHQAPIKSYNEVGHKKKPTSFQITSVTVQGSRLSNDGGDDSADDLDESHTDDLSSDILDCSKTPDLDNEQLTEDNGNTPDDLAMPGVFISPKSFKSDPSIRPIIDSNDVPQHLGVATTFHNNPPVNNSNVTVDTSHSDPVVSSHIPIINTIPDHWQHRFKVVKIVSSEPFKRGRWVCMDFVDPPAMQQEVKPEIIEQSSASGVSSGGSSGNSICGDSAANKTVAHIYEIPVTQSCTGDVSLAVNQQPIQPLYGIILPGETINQTPPIMMVPTVGIQPTSDAVPQVIQNATIQQGVHVTACLPPQQTSQTQLSSANAPSVQHNPLASQTQLVTQAQQPVMPMSQPSAGSQSTLVTNIQNTSLPSAPIDQEVNRQSVSKPDQSSQGPSQAMMSNNNDKAQRMPSDNTPLPLLEVLPGAINSTRNNIEGEDSESASTGPTVAIDNKIEQAMDLVKSHLMFAVREEVDVLKEKITELLERISQLEYENGFLRANASQETLNQLSQIPASQTSAVTQPNVISASTQQQQQSMT